MNAHARQIKYIGHKSQKEDNITRSGLVWRQGEVLPVPATIAAQLLAYPDVWQDVTGELDAGTTGEAGPGARTTALQPVEDLEKAMLRERVAVLEEENHQLKEQLAAATAKPARQPRGARQMMMPAAPASVRPPDEPPLVDLRAMDKEALQNHARIHLGMDLDLSRSEDDLRNHIAETIATRPSENPVTEEGSDVGH